MPQPPSSLAHRQFSPNRRTTLTMMAAFGAQMMLGEGHARADEPTKGGNLRMGLSGASSTDDLDPATYTSTYMQNVGLQIFNTLVEIDEHGTVQPALVEEWLPNATADRWTLKIKKGVSFHNGKGLTASDVVTSLNHHRAEKSTSAAKAYFSTVEDIAASGTNEVTITLSSGNADMPYLLADYHLCIFPDGSNPREGVGTGAFTLEKFEPGLRTITKRNANFWRDDRGFVDSVETIAINDATARSQALLGNQIDLMNRVDPKTVQFLKQHENVNIHNVSGGGHYYFVVRCDQTPYSNVDVRLALKYAIDREQMVRNVALGFGSIGNDHPIPAFNPYFSSDLAQHTYDPDRAKFHWQRAAVDGPVTISIANAAFPGAVDAAALYSEQAAKAGIVLNVDRVPDDGYWASTWMKKPFCGSYSGGRATPDLLYSLNYVSSAAWNETFWKRPDFDSLVAQARAQLDNKKRKEMYARLQAMVAEDGGAIIPMFTDFVDATSTRVQGFKTSPYIEMGGGRAAENVWLSA